MTETERKKNLWWQMATLKIWTIAAEKISKYIAQNTDQDSE